MECGYKFKTVKAAERAAFDKGCPGCGGADIDLAKYTPKAPPKATAEEAHKAAYTVES